MNLVLFLVSILPLVVFQFIPSPMLVEFWSANVPQYIPAPWLVVLGYTIVPLYMTGRWASSLKNKAELMDKLAQANRYMSKRTWVCGIVTTAFIYQFAFVDYYYPFSFYGIVMWNLFPLFVVFLFATLATIWLRLGFILETKWDRTTAMLSILGLRMVFLSIPLGIAIGLAVDEPLSSIGHISWLLIVGLILNRVFVALTKDKSQFVKSEVMEAINNGAARGAKSYLDAQKTNNQRRLRELESRFATGGTLTESEQAEYNSLRGSVG